MLIKLIKSRRLRLALALLLAAGGTWYVNRPDANAAPVVAGSGDTVNILEFSSLSSTKNLPAGWQHQTFWFTPPMELSLREHQGQKALRCETNAGGSILRRSADIDLTEFPLIEWSWFIEDPIDSDVDERTKDGDDHPARLLLTMSDEKGGDHPVEIIWSNRQFMPGDYKYIEKFPHYVANGLDENIGRWHEQSVDLLEIYRTISDHQDKPRLTSAAIFCDSDNTGTRSVAYFTDIMLRKR